MPEHELTTTQRNDVLKAIREGGLRPEDFHWAKQASRVTVGSPYAVTYEALYVPVLIHEPTEAAFAFDLDSEHASHYARFHPGREGPTEEVRAVVWESELAYLGEWLRLVKREHESPDLWAEIGREQELVAPPSDDEENTPFTEQEQAQIALHLGELKELLSARYHVEGEKLEELEARIEYLEQAARRRVGRIDWRQILVSQFFQLVARAVIPVDALHDAFQFLAHGIGHLFGSGPPQLPGI